MNPLKLNCTTLILFLFLVHFSFLPAEAQPEKKAGSSITIQADVEFGQDIGQNFGTLFEIMNEKGETLGGAGFQECYNTESRSDRHTLHFYLNSDLFPEKANFETLPRPSTDSGVYLEDFQGELFAHSRSGDDTAPKSWNEKEGKWKTSSDPLFQTQIGSGILRVTPENVVFNKSTLLELSAEEGFIREYYYANGFLVIRLQNLEADPQVNELKAIPWTPQQTAPMKLEQALSLPLRWEREFIYAFGLLKDDIIVATNTGGVYCLKGNNWKVLLEPDRNVSFQIYAIINYYDQLLMGQYPTGELYSYDGSSLSLIKGWPPVMKGVSSRAREAQSLAIYGGNLYVGVWPWAEVWQYRKSDNQWSFTKRMFTHPELTDKYVHPYEEESKKLGVVLNLWGQRVTSLYPIKSSLYISTSSKGAVAQNSRYVFLDEEKGKEYGQVYKMTLPGNLSVPIHWKEKPVQFQFSVTGGKMQISQDGEILGELSMKGQEKVLKKVLEDQQWKLVSGKGIYGQFRGKSLNTQMESN